MNRRSFLSFVGGAPLAAIVPAVGLSAAVPELIVDGAITADRIWASGVTAARISASAITTAQIRGSAITGSKITVGSIMVGRIA